MSIIWASVNDGTASRLTMPFQIASTSSICSFTLSILACCKSCVFMVATELITAYAFKKDRQYLIVIRKQLCFSMRGETWWVRSLNLAVPQEIRQLFLVLFKNGIKALQNRQGKNDLRGWEFMFGVTLGVFFLKSEGDSLRLRLQQ